MCLSDRQTDRQTDTHTHIYTHIHVRLRVPERFIIKVSNSLKPGTSQSIGWTSLSGQGSAARGGFDFWLHLTALQERVISLRGRIRRAGTGEGVKTEVPERMKSALV